MEVQEKLLRKELSPYLMSTQVMNFVLFFLNETSIYVEMSIELIYLFSVINLKMTKKLHFSDSC